MRPRTYLIALALSALIGSGLGLLLRVYGPDEICLVKKK